MRTLIVAVQVLGIRAAHRLTHRLRDQRGQSTAEYALVLLGAAAVALLLVAWATNTNKVTELFDGVLDKLLGDLS